MDSLERATAASGPRSITLGMVERGLRVSSWCYSPEKAGEREQIPRCGGGATHLGGGCGVRGRFGSGDSDLCLCRAMNMRGQLGHQANCELCAKRGRAAARSGAVV